MMLVFSSRFLSTLLVLVSICWAKNITIDDRDPAITYSTPVCPIISQCDTSKNWWLSTSLDDPPSYSNGTAHVSNAPGLSAQLTFQGSDIYLYTSRGSTGGSAFVTVDANTPVLVDNHNAFSQQRVPTFHSGGLDPAKSHIITVTIGGNTSVAGYFELDFFAIIAPDDPTSTAPSSANPTQASGSTSQPAFPQSKSSVPVGAIVGGVLGGLAFLVIVAFAIYRYRRSINRRPNVDWSITPDAIPETTENPLNPHAPPEYNSYDYVEVSQYAQNLYSTPSQSTSQFHDTSASSTIPPTPSVTGSAAPIRPTKNPQS